jgi:hypothetical protein
MHFFSIGIIILSSNQHYYYKNVIAYEQQKVSYAGVRGVL